jgi:hypothetical protein
VFHHYLAQPLKTYIRYLLSSQFRQLPCNFIYLWFIQQCYQYWEYKISNAMVVSKC